MITIAVINRKGGVAKTTTAQSIGAYFNNKGKRVLLVDLDPQCNLSFVCKVKPAGADALTSLFMGGNILPLIRNVREGLDLIPGAEQYALADNLVTETGKEYKLREALSQVSSGYDYCVIDTPPALGILTVDALTTADYIVIPVLADLYALNGVIQLSKTIQVVKQYTNPGLKIAGLLMCRYSPRAIVSRAVLDEMSKLAESLNTRVFNTTIRQSIALTELTIVQTDIYTHAPKSNGAKDYTAFMEELEAVING